jgi:hypothetical protein
MNNLIRFLFPPIEYRADRYFEFVLVIWSLVVRDMHTPPRRMAYARI